MKRINSSLFPSLLLVFVLCAAFPCPTSWAQSLLDRATLPEGTVLRLALSERTSINHTGQDVRARVVEPVYAYDRLIIPLNAEVYGTIVALKPIPKGERILAMTGGDFTPFHDPEIQFDQLVMPDGRVIDIDTAASNRNTKVVELRDRRSKGKPMLASGKEMARDKLGLSKEGPGKLDLIKNELLSYLPYHPQSLDKGSLLDAVLEAPLTIDVPAVDPPDVSHVGETLPPDTLLHARLMTEMSSAASENGEEIRAVLTEPVWGDENELLYPEGTILTGSVIKSKRSGWFGRSGELRFVFRSLQIPSGPETAIKGNIEALEAQKNVGITLDAEGGTRAHMNNRFIMPLLNFGLAKIGSKQSDSRIKRAVVSNGFNLVGRIAGIVGPQNLVVGLSHYGLARSLYMSFIRKGPEARFPTNTRLEIRVSPRQAQQ